MSGEIACTRCERKSRGVHARPGCQGGGMLRIDVRLIGETDQIGGAFRIPAIAAPPRIIVDRSSECRTGRRRRRPRRASNGRSAFAPISKRPLADPVARAAMVRYECRHRDDRSIDAPHRLIPADDLERVQGAEGGASAAALPRAAWFDEDDFSTAMERARTIHFRRHGARAGQGGDAKSHFVIRWGGGRASAHGPVPKRETLNSHHATGWPAALRRQTSATGLAGGIAQTNK